MNNIFKGLMFFVILLIVFMEIGDLLSLRIQVNKINQMLPLMEQWHSKMTDYKLAHGNYHSLSAKELGITWPDGWKETRGANYLKGEDKKGEWSCHINLNLRGSVQCRMNGQYPSIALYQPDESFLVNLAGKRICHSNLHNTDADAICKALGGTKITTAHTVEEMYSYEF